MSLVGQLENTLDHSFAHDCIRQLWMTCESDIGTESSSMFQWDDMDWLICFLRLIFCICKPVWWSLWWLIKSNWIFFVLIFEKTSDETIICWEALKEKYLGKHKCTNSISISKFGWPSS